MKRVVKGILYGVGVGPGDPQLMTLKAVDTIKHCPVIAAPRTRSGAMVALDIVKGAHNTVNLAGKEILPLDFAMSRNTTLRERSHNEAATALRTRLDAGLDVALLNLGDISIYATFRYIADILRPEGYTTKMIPGVPSFCAAAARLGESLTTDMNAPLHIIPDGQEEPDKARERTGTTVWMKSGNGLPTLLNALSEAGLSEKVAVVQNCGLPEERIYQTLTDATVEPAYFTVAILKNSGEEQTQ